MKTKITTTIFLCLSMTALVFTSSCNKIKISKDVNWGGQDVQVTVPIVPDNQLHGAMGTNSFTYNLDSMINAKTNGVLGLKDITKLTISSVKVTVTNPDAANNFANFELCDLFFNTNLNPVTVHTATIENNPDVYADTLMVPVDKNVDLKSYIYSANTPVAKNTVTYVIGGKLRRPTTKELILNIHVEYIISVTQS